MDDARVSPRRRATLSTVPDPDPLTVAALADADVLFRDVTGRLPERPGRDAALADAVRGEIALRDRVGQRKARCRPEEDDVALTGSGRALVDDLDRRGDADVTVTAVLEHDAQTVGSALDVADQTLAVVGREDGAATDERVECDGVAGEIYEGGHGGLLRVLRDGGRGLDSVLNRSHESRSRPSRTL